VLLIDDRSPGALVALGWNARIAAEYRQRAGDSTELARVVRVERTQSCAIGGDGGERVITAPSTPAVGDWVVLADGHVVDVLPRSSVLTRVDPDEVRIQTLAANLDLVIITVPADRPSPARIDRELAIAWASGAEPFVCLTKGDLAPPDLVASLRARLGGLEVTVTSAARNEGIDDLRRLLAPNRTAVLLGPSGAGKSTLANALVGNDDLATGSVRADRRGRHTTTSRQLVIVPTGGIIIDTPGVRALALAEDTIEQVFPEIAALVRSCRFANCAHEREPGCAVVKALVAGKIDHDRLARYRKLTSGASAPAATRQRSSKGHGARRHEHPPSPELDDDLDDDEPFT
jgi:ribosome biogenesis GTPase